MARATSRTKRRSSGQTALDLLKADHAEVKKLFKQFEKFKKSEDSEGMQRIAQAACKALTIHAQIEEEIFYPALRESADADDALDEANVEHAHVKELVQQVGGAEPGEDLYEARVTVLSEYVQHHADEEESTIFPKARKSDVDLVALGEQLLARKEELSGGEESPDVAALAAREQSRKRDGQSVRGQRS
jgi:hemerythrin superfamily protein